MQGQIITIYSLCQYLTESSQPPRDLLITISGAEE